MVDDGWTEVDGVPSMGGLLRKLGSSRKKLRVWSIQIRGRTRKTLRVLKEKLEELELNASSSWAEHKVCNKS